LREAAPAEEWRPRVIWHDGKQFVEYNGKRISSAIRDFVSPDKILLEMERSGVEGVLICPWVSLVRYEAKAEESLTACQVQNDALAALSKKYPNRIAALGIVPLQDVPLAIKELERMMKSGLKGVEIGTQVNGVYPGDIRFHSFWEACEELGTFVFIHPVEGDGRVELSDYYLWNVIGNPMETTIAAGHLILAGVMEMHSRLKILLAHGGGTLPYLHGRLDRGFKQRPEVRKMIKRPPTEYIKQFYIDTITHDPHVLCGLIEFVGADHVLLGSDYPFDMGYEKPVDILHSSGLTSDIEKMILEDNAASLLGWNIKGKGELYA
jgi:aminocarboxymuconate-semialdehyde decarboxylase